MRTTYLYIRNRVIIILKVSIVDDEHIVLSRLKQMLNKLNDPELILENSFDNGDDAYNQLSLSPPDILITDIHIPFITGMELAKMLKKINPLMKIIVITGYEELKYAKEAIDLEVVGFLSKPIAYEELTKVITKAKEKIIHELDVLTNINEFNKFYADNLPILRENYLSKLFDSNVVDKGLYDYLDNVELNLDYKNFALAYFDLDHGYNYEEQVKFKFFLKNEFSQMNYNYDVFNKANGLYVLIKDNEPINLETVSDQLRFIIVKSERQMNIEVSIGLSSIVKGLEDFKRIYHEAIKSVQTRKIFGGMQVFLFTDLNDSYDQSTFLSDVNFNELTHLIRYENDESIILKKLNELKNIVSLPNNIKLFAFNNTNILNAILKAINEEIDLSKYNIEYHTLYQTLFEFKVVDDIFDWFYEISTRIQKLNVGYIENKTSHNMDLITNYVANNYQDDNLNLDSLSIEVNFSVSYITKLFKTIEKTTFVKYLTAIRMEKAKELLLNTNNKIIEISKEVGYKDPYYFSYSFKRYFGIAPKEFRDESI